MKRRREEPKKDDLDIMRVVSMVSTGSSDSKCSDTSDSKWENVNFDDQLVDLVKFALWNRPNHQLDAHQVETIKRNFCAVVKNVVPKLKPYQRHGIGRILQRAGRTLLYDEMGLGKTLQALVSMALICISQNAWPVLIVVPASLRMTWLEQLETWLTSIDLSHVTVIKDGKTLIGKNSKIIITSYRMMEENMKELKALNIKFLIADEVHKTRTFNSKQTINMLELSHGIRFMVLLTGTPMLIRPFELFPQLQMVLNKEDKNHLLKNWGYNRQQGILAHLELILTKPIDLLQEVCAYTGRTWNRDWMQEFQKMYLEDSGNNKTFETYWNTMENQRKNVILQLLDSLVNQVHGLVFNGLKKSFPISIPDKSLPTFSVQFFREKLLCLIGFWRTICSSEHVRTVLHLWDAHRFGVVYCRGKQRKAFARDKRDRIVWEYAGVTKRAQKIIRSVMQPYQIRRKKDDVLSQLPAKKRSVVMVVPSNTKVHSNIPISIFDNDQAVKMVSVGTSRSDLISLSMKENDRPENITWQLHETGLAKAPCVAEYLIDLLDNLDIKERIIVFAHHLDVLNIIYAKLLEKRGEIPTSSSYKKYNSAYLSGSVPVLERDKVVDSFQNDNENGPRVLLLSLMAMGTGFTLTRSSLVIMAELYWSPQILLQAEDRVHRIGQKQSVRVQYILAANSLDTRLYPIISSRLEKMENVLTAASGGNAKPGLAMSTQASQGTSIRNINQERNRTVQKEDDSFSQELFRVDLSQLDEFDDDDDEEEEEEDNEGDDEVQILGNMSSSSSSLVEPRQRSNHHHVPGVSKTMIKLFERLQGIDVRMLHPYPCVAENLRFKISSTHRVHLYEAIDERNGPQQQQQQQERSLGENFSIANFKLAVDEWIDRLEDQTPISIELLGRLPERLRDPTSQVFSKTQSFLEEWMELKSITQGELQASGKALNSPLGASVAAVSVSTSMSASFDRTLTSTYQMHKACMETVGMGNYVVAFVKYKQKKQGTKSNEQEIRTIQQAFHPQLGRPFCLMCGGFYDSKHRMNVRIGVTGSSQENSKTSVAVPVIQINAGIKALFCGSEAPCYRSWLVKCYQKTARVILSDLEQGICQMCKVDTRTMCREVQSSPPDSKLRENLMFCPDGKVDGFCPHVQTTHFGTKKIRKHWSDLQRGYLGKDLVKRLLHSKSLSEGNFWDADHIVAVKLGGGNSSLENFQTLCKPCHNWKTKEDRKKMRDLAKLQAKHSSRANSETKRTTSSLTATTSPLDCIWCGFSSKDEQASIMHNLICPRKPSENDVDDSEI